MAYSSRTSRQERLTHYFVSAQVPTTTTPDRRQCLRGHHDVLIKALLLFNVYADDVFCPSVQRRKCCRFLLLNTSRVCARGSRTPLRAAQITTARRKCPPLKWRCARSTNKKHDKKREMLTRMTRRRGYCPSLFACVVCRLIKRVNLFCVIRDHDSNGAARLPFDPHLLYSFFAASDRLYCSSSESFCLRVASTTGSAAPLSAS